jgi:hypothetical protein
MVESRRINRLHKFLWAQYGSKGLDLCTVDLRLWMARILEIDPFEEKSGNPVRQRLVDEGRIIVHDTRVEVINPYGEQPSWHDYVSRIINEYEEKHVT